MTMLAVFGAAILIMVFVYKVLTSHETNTYFS